VRLTTLTLLLCFVLAPLACASKSGTQSARQTAPHPPPPVSVAGTDDAAPAGAVAKSATCALLSNEEIKAVQGEEPSDAQGSEHLTGSLSMSQCFYRLPTFSKSINLEVTRAAPGAPPDAVADFWRKSFGRAAQEEREQKRGREEQSEREREKELERERASGGVREGGHAEEEERGEGDEGPRPQRVAGVGDEAYWSGNPINAALYVLRKDTVIRLSIGGPEDPSVKIKKAKTLAQKVLKHF
jgi:hypothetical protein